MFTTNKKIKALRWKTNEQATKKHSTVVLREQQYRHYRRKAMTTRLHHRPRMRALQKVKGLNGKKCRLFYRMYVQKMGMK